MRTLQVLVICIFAVLVGRLFYIQLIDPRYEELARTNTLRRVVQYATRGEVFDRNGEYLVQSRACYDLMVTYKDLKRTDSTRYVSVPSRKSPAPSCNASWPMPACHRAYPTS